MRPMKAPYPGIDLRAADPNQAEILGDWGHDELRTQTMHLFLREIPPQIYHTNLQCLISTLGKWGKVNDP